MALNCYFQPPKYEVGNNIASFVEAFEVFFTTDSKQVMELKSMPF